MANEIKPIVRAQVGYPPSTNVRSKVMGAIKAFLVAPYAPNPLDTRKFGVDLSQYNTVNLQALADYMIPCEYAMIRIGGSASVKDTKFKQYWDAAKAAKIPRSIYTYNWPGWTIEQHIRNFMASVNLWTPGDLGDGPIWADIETHPEGKTRAEISNHAIGYIEALERETGKVVGWYTGAWFVNGYMQVQDWMTEKWAWLATYATGREHPGPVVIPKPIPEELVVIQQTGSQCDAKLVGGVGTFDTDRWDGTVEQFDELWNTETGHPPELEQRVEQNEKDIEDIMNVLAELNVTINDLDEWVRSYGQ